MTADRPSDFVRDVFISHASEDKEAIARPLADELRARDCSVWYDEFELLLGDSLRTKLSLGLRQSRVGVVILSRSFFAKRWTEWELNGLTARQMAGEPNVLLPVWHDVGSDEVRAFSAPLADVVAARSSNGVHAVADEVMRVLAWLDQRSPTHAPKPDGSIAFVRDRTLVRMARLGADPTGRQLFQIVDAQPWSKDDGDARGEIAEDERAADRWAAVELSEPHPQQDARRYRAEVTETRSVANTLLLAAQTAGDVAKISEGLQLVAECDLRIGDTGSAMRRLDDAVATAEKDPVAHAEALLSRSTLGMTAGDAESARRDADIALRQAEVGQAWSIASLARTQSAGILLAAGDPTGALEELDAAFSLARQLRLQSAKARALSVVGCAFEFDGRHSEAAEVWQRVILLCERAGDAAALGAVYNNLGVLNHTKGQLVSALPYLERAAELLNRADLVQIIGVLNNLVRAHEECYFERASVIRTAAEDFADLMHDRTIPRFDDLRVIYAAATPRADASDSYAGRDHGFLPGSDHKNSPGW